MDNPSPEYPKRPPVFVCKFIRRMGESCLANDLGPDACWLLAYIASIEDATRYRAAVSFFNEDLATRTGLSLAGMKRARQKAVDAGWLHHEPGAKGRAARYWVLVPRWADDVDDEGLSGSMSAQGEPVSDREPIPAQGEPTSNQHRSGIDPACEPHYVLVLDPNPSQPADAGESVPTRTPEASPAAERACEPTKPGPKVAEVVAAWNAQANLIACRSADANRERMIRTWSTHKPEWVADWRAVIEFLGRSPQHTGGTGLSWRADLNWLIDESNFAKARDLMLAASSKPKHVPHIHDPRDNPGYDPPTAAPYPKPKPRPEAA